MSGMKISLDAAMRARDVSSPDWRDDSPVAGDEVARTADPARTIHAVANARDATAPAGDPDSSEARAAVAPTPTPDGPASGATQAGNAQRRRANGRRRRRRTRLRPGGPI